MTIKAHRGGQLTLPQTGYTLTCFNAPDVTLPPCAEVLLYMGRQDKTCREYQGYPETGIKPSDISDSRRIPADQTHYLVNESCTFRFTASSGVANMYLCVADHSCEPCAIELYLNNRLVHSVVLTPGYGYQNRQPNHLASNQCIQIPIQVSEQDNTVTIQVTAGWFTWDALSIVEA